jgi:hypothetical protein
MTLRNPGSARSVKDYFPDFKSAGPFFDAPESWAGPIRPFASCGPADQALVLDDLAHGAQVLLQRGSLLHDPGCPRHHDPVPYIHRMENAGQEVFSVRLLVWPPPKHPKVVALYPEISGRACPGHPHLFQHPQHPRLPEFPAVMPDALCTYRPSDGEWSWRHSDLVLALDYAALYLAKHVVWQRTGGGANGLWIGPQASHEPSALVRELHPAAECRCGNGRRYGDCCLPMDRFRVDAMARFKDSYGASRAAHRRTRRPAA